MDDKNDRDQICIQSNKDGEEEEEEWSVSCSDDEKYNLTSSMKSKVAWEPKVEEIVQLYTTLNEKGILDLEWHCPGRRSPSPPASEDQANDSDEGSHNSESVKDPEPNEFDFDESFSDTATTTTPRRSIGSNSKLKGSGQKRTATMKNVMSDILRHRKLEGLENEPS